MGTDYVTIRACQQRVTDDDPLAWLCSIGDVGDEHDIHPKVKQPVGERLALLALRYVYGWDVLADAPRATSVSRDGDRVEVSFENVGEGLVVEGDPVNALEVLVADEAVSFSAHAEDNRLVIELEEPVADDVCIRFAQANWFCINLYNSTHIPALPFELSC